MHKPQASCSIIRYVWNLMVLPFVLYAPFVMRIYSGLYSTEYYKRMFMFVSCIICMGCCMIYVQNDECCNDVWYDVPVAKTPKAKMFK